MSYRLWLQNHRIEKVYRKPSRRMAYLQCNGQVLGYMYCCRTRNWFHSLHLALPAGKCTSGTCHHFEPEQDFLEWLKINFQRKSIFFKIIDKERKYSKFTISYRMHFRLKILGHSILTMRSIYVQNLRPKIPHSIFREISCRRSKIN